MIELRKIKTEEEIMKILDLFLQSTNTTQGTYEEKDFLIVTGWKEVEEINIMLDNYMDQNWDAYQIESIYNSDSWGFGDEYSTCSNCNGIIKTSPDYYGSPIQYMSFECAILCRECLTIEEILPEYVNNPLKCVPSNLFNEYDFEIEGFKKLNEESYERGLHPGQNDDPKTIIKEFEKQYTEIIFLLTETSQFYIKFDVMGRGAANVSN